MELLKTNKTGKRDRRAQVNCVGSRMLQRQRLPTFYCHWESSLLAGPYLIYQYIGPNLHNQRCRTPTCTSILLSRRDVHFMCELLCRHRTKQNLFYSSALNSPHVFITHLNTWVYPRVSTLHLIILFTIEHIWYHYSTKLNVIRILLKLI